MISSYNDLTVSQYEKIVGIINSDYEPKKKDLMILSILNGTLSQDILARPYEEVKDMLSIAMFLSEKPNVKKVNSFSYCGFDFKVNKKFSLTYAQYVDVESSTSMVSLLHCILVPEGYSYNTYEIDFSDLPFLTAKYIIDSFMRSSIVCVERALKSLKYRMQALSLLKRSSLNYPQLDSLIASIHSLLSSRRLQM